MSTNVSDNNSTKGSPLTGYQKSIVADCGCSPKEAVEVEDLMRDVIFHSTLDWQTAKEFRKGAREAFDLLKAMR